MSAREMPHMKDLKDKAEGAAHGKKGGGDKAAKLKGEVRFGLGALLAAAAPMAGERLRREDLELPKVLYCNVM